MRKALTCLVLLLCAALDGFAWGPTGHRVTGLIAERHLTKKARSAIERILDGQSLAMASTWMDEVRSDTSFDFMTDWHWVTIPMRQTYGETIKNANGDLVQALEKAISELRTKKLTGAEQAERLRILIHLVGDIHQPLHVGDRDDRGGNAVVVTWFGVQSNLHRVWDSDMIDDSRLSYTELAESMARPSPAEVRSWQKSPVLKWAMESQSYATQVYNIGNGRLAYEYVYVNFPLVRQRLLQAGIRLAGILNDIYR